MSARLLDTHVWLSYAEGVAERLRPASVRKLDEARKGDGLLVSAISVREIGMHATRGRIQLAVPLRDGVERASVYPAFALRPRVWRRSKSCWVAVFARNSRQNVFRVQEKPALSDQHIAATTMEKAPCKPAN